MGTGGAAAGNSDQCYTTPTWKTNGNPDYITYDKTGTYLDVPQTDHYTFEGWFTAPVGGTKIADNTGKVLVANAFAQNNTQLYAHWSPMYSGTYVYDEASLRAIGTTGTYHIVKDISLSTLWTQLDSFSGTIDGHGHTISDLAIKYESDSTHYGEEVENYGFIRELKGTIQNLNFKRVAVAVTKYKDGMDNSNVGVIAGVLNGGTLRNITLTEVNLTVDHYREVSASGAYVNTRAGGFVGHMSSGKIENCSIGGTSSIWSKAGRATSSADAQCFAGGIVGYLTSGTITGCSRADTVSVTSRSRVDGKNSASRSAAGGIVGVRDTGTVSSCTSTVTNVSGTWDHASGADYSSNYSWKQSGAIVGRGG
jgi:uncharacterized repeat protein (TIGR02543 family)